MSPTVITVEGLKPRLELAFAGNVGKRFRAARVHGIALNAAKNEKKKRAGGTSALEHSAHLEA